MPKFISINKKNSTNKQIQRITHGKIKKQKKQKKQLKTVHKQKKHIQIHKELNSTEKLKIKNLRNTQNKKQDLIISQQNITSLNTISNQKTLQIENFNNHFLKIPKCLKITIIEIAKGCTLDAVHKDELNFDLAKVNDQEFVYPHDAHQILKNISQSYRIQRIYLKPHYNASINQIKMMEDKTDVFINLYDLSDQTGQKIVDYMENNNIAFTGAGARLYNPTRQSLKKVCAYSGVPTPQHTFISSKDLQNISQIVKNFKSYPLFVKPQLGYDSVGIDKDSVVYNLKDLKKKCKQVIEKHGSALVEKYIDGRQFSVLIAGNKSKNFVFSPVEYIFNKKINQKFITFQDKWGSSTSANWMILDLKNEKELIINKKLQLYSKKIFEAFDDNGYARIDFREDRITGQLYALDYNPNCSVFYKNDQATADNILRLMGLRKDFLMKILVQNALQRSNKNKQINRFTIVYDQNHKADAIAKYQIKKNQIVYTDQMFPLRLVTKQYVQKNWTKKQIDSLSKQAWPIGFNTYAIIDQNLKSWRPLNHSCDPNCWMQGLSVVARKNISKGQKLTLDYSTFKPSFNLQQCQCNSKQCRKIIKSNAYTEKQFQLKYKGHCSAFIQYLIETNQK